MSERTFDASRYLVTLKGKDYLEVKWRLLWLRTEHPEAAIETELVRLDEGYAVFKAKVAIPQGGSATGWGSEEASDFPDFLEKAETKALGRALAALGYGTQFTEEFVIERDGEQGFVDAPVERPRRDAGARALHQAARAAAPGARAVTEQATPAQVNAIYAIGRKEHAWNDEDLDSHCRASYGKLPSELTKREASEFIDQLKDQLKTAPIAS